MKDKTLLRITKEFTEGILGDRSPHKMCFAVCAPLQTYLSFTSKFETELVEGCVNTDWQHFWLKLPDGRILDPTASQFKGMPQIYLGALPENYIVYPRP
jgi:hypothetical protein